MTSRIPYSYSVLRYVHDVVTGEFVNVGVVMYSAEGRFLKFKCRSSAGRVLTMFPSVRATTFKALLRSIKQRFNILEAECSGGLPMWEQRKDINEILLSALPKDDSSLIWSPIADGAASNLSQSFEKIYARQVSKFDHKISANRRSDEDVWRQFRRDLEQRNLLSFFESKSITTIDDEIEFPFAWKNGIWHCIEPISFDLTAPESIRDKAHRWLGQITSVTNTSEKFKIYLVLAEPRSENLLPAFKKAIGILEKAPVESEIYVESTAWTLVDKLHSQIDSHHH